MYFLRRQNEILMQPDPNMPEKRLKQKIAENNAEMAPWIADSERLEVFKNEFVQEVRKDCEKVIDKI